MFGTPSDEHENQGFAKVPLCLYVCIDDYIWKNWSIRLSFGALF